MTDRSAGQSAPREFLIGSRIAGYRLEERIGAGGMAVVFRAYDSRLDRYVALKVLAPGLDLDDAFRQRFIRESRAAAAVDDPHIIPVFEAGEADGVLFIAMRYVRGGDVRSLIDRTGPLPPGRVADIVSQAAAALDAAHARGLVHRDVKPANMLLDSRPAADLPDHVYLSDFGLTKTSVGTSLALTATGEFMGTLEYVAPEQIEGRALDGRCDEYALACAAFEMLCGRPPFRRDQGISVMYAHLNEPPPAIRRYRPELPARLDDVLGRALAKAPADRYSSCGEFGVALRQVLGSANGGQRHAGAARPETQLALPPVDSRVAPGPTVAGGSRPDVRISSSADVGQTQPPGYREPTVRSHAGPSTSPQGRSSSQADAAGEDGWPARPAGTPLLPPGADRGRQGRPPVSPAAGRAGRPWWRSPAAVGGLCVLALVLAAVGFLLANRSHPEAAGAAVTLKPPGCTHAVARAPQLTGVRSSTVGIPGAFGVAVQGSYAFVSGGNAVTVLRDAGPGVAPVVQRVINVPGAGKGDQITHDGRYVLAAAGSGAVVISVAGAENGAADPIVGTLTSRGGGSGAAEVALSPDDQYAFVTVQDNAVVAVFNLGAALAGTFGSADFVGDVPVGPSPVGLAAAAGSLYVANEGASQLSVLSMTKAETDPAHAVRAMVPAGCGPARAVVSGNGQVLWVTAQGSDALLGFSTAKLTTDPAHALIADVRVGEAPLGIALVAGGSRVIVADSDQDNAPGVSSSLAVVDTQKALDGKKAVLGYVATRTLPRQFAVEADGTLLVTVTNSHVVQAVDVRGLP